MPDRFLTEDGPRPDLAERFGLLGCPEPGYPARTRRNVAEADAVLILGRGSRGSDLTRSLAQGAGLPVLWMHWAADEPFQPGDAAYIVRWLRTRGGNPERLMVAGNREGNRESGNPGIGAATFDLLDRVFAQLARLDKPAPPVKA